MPKRSDSAFEDLARAAAAETECPILLVEKDFWITLILKELIQEFDQLIIFKGGTSLSKAWKLIDRFSEDVDVLLDSEMVSTKSQKRARISRFRTFLETVPGLVYLPESKQGEDHGSLWFGYDSVFEDLQQKILIEVGFRGGSQPTELRAVNSIIGELLVQRGKTDIRYNPFSIRTLHLKRTLIEKLFALAAAYEDNSLPKKTRHYYDVDRVLGDPELKTFLLSPELFELARDVEKVTRQEFGANQDLEWLVNSPAFSKGSSNYDEVKRGYEKDGHLYFAGQPPFDQVHQNVRTAIEQIRVRLTSRT
jgi:uncharacterized protein YozE (UPF0346 family)